MIEAKDFADKFGIKWYLDLDLDSEKKMMLVAWDSSKLKRIHNLDTGEEMLVVEK